MMVLLDDNVYEETKMIIQGKKILSPILRELSMWLDKEYSIKALNFEFSKLTPQNTRYRLYIILNSNVDVDRMLLNDKFRSNPKYQKQISNEFRRLAKEYSFTCPSNLDNLFVAFNNFSEEARTEANWKAIKEAEKSLQSKYQDKDVAIWRIEAEFAGAIVFYLSDSDVYKYNHNGVSNNIKLDYYSILKKYDEMKYYTFDSFIMSFDSKENVDKNYKGSLLFYSRR